MCHSALDRWYMSPFLPVEICRCLVSTSPAQEKCVLMHQLILLDHSSPTCDLSPFPANFKSLFSAYFKSQFSVYFQSPFSAYFQSPFSAYFKSIFSLLLLITS